MGEGSTVKSEAKAGSESCYHSGVDKTTNFTLCLKEALKFSG